MSTNLIDGDMAGRHVAMGLILSAAFLTFDAYTSVSQETVFRAGKGTPVQHLLHISMCSSVICIICTSMSKHVSVVCWAFLWHLWGDSSVFLVYFGVCLVSLYNRFGVAFVCLK